MTGCVRRTNLTAPPPEALHNAPVQPQREGRFRPAVGDGGEGAGRVGAHWLALLLSLSRTLGVRLLMRERESEGDGKGRCGYGYGVPGCV